MGDNGGAVTFDVRGQLFKVLPEFIKAQPNTFLAQLLSDIGTNCNVPIFVDANPKRFHHILDWYRYGQMFLPKGASINALLHDAMYFALPDVVEVNGIDRRLPQPRAAKEWTTEETIELDSQELRSELEAVVLEQWPEFGEVLEAKTRQIQEKLFASVRDSAICSDVLLTTWNSKRGLISIWPVKALVAFAALIVCVYL